MASKKKIILISGAGQLGSRYLQGLSGCKYPFRIYVNDISKAALVNSESLWSETSHRDDHHEVTFHESPKDIPEQLDLVINATTANNRHQIIANISKHSKVSYWILEKVLAQSEKFIDEINDAIGYYSKAWVNTPRRIIPWHQAILKKHILRSPIHLKLYGGKWGLACNSLHFLDLLAWLSGESLIDIDTNNLNDLWIKAKREGSWEIYGSLIAKFSGGSTAELISEDIDRSNYLYELIDNSGSWIVDEFSGSAKHSSGFELPGRIPYQSEMTASLVDEVLEYGTCGLPSLQTSSALHKVFIVAMLKHWQKHVNNNAVYIPIT